MSDDSEMRARAEAAVHKALAEGASYFRSDYEENLTALLQHFAADEAALAKRVGAREERRTIYQHVSSQRDWLIINKAAFNSVVVELKIEELDSLLAWLRGREEESERK